MFPAISESMTQRYLPQYQQFGLTLEGRGAGLFGTVSSEIGSGSAWIMPVSEHCLVLEHAIVPTHDMQLLEITPQPYACVTEVNVKTIECMPEAHINPSSVRPIAASLLANPVCTFLQSECGEGYSPLKGGSLYYSRSILLEPGFFKELDSRYPGQFKGLFEAFGKHWTDEASHAIYSTLHNLRAERSLAPGAHLYAQSVINAMVAELAAANAAEAEAEAAQGTNRQANLASRAANYIENCLAQGRCPSIQEVAERTYSSRSVLCAAFKQEVGESIGAFTQRRRSQMAEELLAEGNLSVAQVASRLGYSRQSAFTQAFKQAHGLSPTQWQRQAI